MSSGLAISNTVKQPIYWLHTSKDVDHEQRHSHRPMTGLLAR